MDFQGAQSSRAKTQPRILLGHQKPSPLCPRPRLRTHKTLCSWTQVHTRRHSLLLVYISSDTSGSSDLLCSIARDLFPTSADTRDLFSYKQLEHETVPLPQAHQLWLDLRGVCLSSLRAQGHTSYRPIPPQP